MLLRVVMPSAPWVAVLLVLAQLCATIEVTNEDFNVQRGVGFEVRWKDAEDANVVDISLWKFPVYRYVETLDSKSLSALFLRGSPPFRPSAAMLD